jgi:hypothetical protein
LSALDLSAGCDSKDVDVVIGWVVVRGARVAATVKKKIRIKLTSSVNFINVLQAAFAPVDPKSVKRH